MIWLALCFICCEQKAILALRPDTVTVQALREHLKRLADVIYAYTSAQQASVGASTNALCTANPMCRFQKFLTPSSDLDGIWTPSSFSYVQLPFYSSTVAAGFPSPADDHIDNLIDLNEQFIENPSATFITRAAGHSMTGVGIHDGDVLIVDCSKEARHGDVVVVALNGDLTCKRLFKQNGNIFLDSANPDYPPIELHEGDDMRVWGVVLHSIHKP